MLSKVLKGKNAQQVRSMAFTIVPPAPSELHPQTSPRMVSTQSPGGEEHANLAGRIRELESELQTAKQVAFDSGFRQGEQQAGAAIAPVLERMNSSLHNLIAMRPTLRRQAEKDAVGLSLQIARRILHRELNVDKNALNALARVVFDRLTRTEKCHIKLNPRFADAVRSALPVGVTPQVQIEADPDCEPGTFILRCPEGTIDASIGSQLDEISRGLTDRLAPQ